MKTKNAIILSKIEGIITGIVCTMDKDSNVRTVLENVAQTIYHVRKDENESDTEE